MITLQQAVEDALAGSGLDEVWLGAEILEAWPHVVGAERANRARPILERSDLKDRRRLVIEVPHPTWTHQLSFLDIAGRINERLGREAIREVRFQIGSRGPR